MKRLVPTVSIIAFAITSLLTFAARPLTTEFALYRGKYRGEGISGSYAENTPVILLRDSSPYTCRAKTKQANSLMNEVSGRKIPVTTLSPLEPPCDGASNFFLAVVGDPTIKYEYLPLKNIADASVRGALDKKIRSLSDVETLREAARRDYPQLSDIAFFDPKLFNLYELALPGTVGYFAEYSAVSGIHTSTFYRVIGNTVSKVGSYWIRNQDGLKTFKINGVLYLYIRGLGNTTGWVLDVIYQVGATGFERVLFNDDLAT